MSDQKLQRCPFCGGNAKLVKKEFGAYVFCEGCGARTRNVIVSVNYSAKDEATMLWERRIANEEKDTLSSDIADDWYKENFTESDAYKGNSNEAKGKL